MANTPGRMRYTWNQLPGTCTRSNLAYPARGRSWHQSAVSGSFWASAREGAPSWAGDQMAERTVTISIVQSFIAVHPMPRWGQCANQLYRELPEGRRRYRVLLAADVDHGARSAHEIGLADVMALFFPVHHPTNELHQFGVGRAAAHQLV